MKLLIIEDDEVFANTVKRRLEKYHFSCWHASNANDALLACHRYLPDYILLDMKLEHESGLQLIKPLRKIRPNSRIILLTGFASIATAVDAIKLGADDYLTKPADTSTLLAALNDKKIPAEIPQAEDVLSAEQAEWQHIQQALKFNNGNISATARQLSMHRRTLQRKLQKRPAALKNE
ncbi:response regulator [Thalassomonas sp. RHCl1]|uniref:response regulator transcription factor n=1 Tax=Thalassomonas sp. RHCl1 TaxID=2995320 RepID=UPI00248ADF81|nr:response regulator [Thalassomonas sp. RHCl1]